MTIRNAVESDIPGLNRLLLQVLTVHHNGRPDLFRANARKYTDSELRELLHDDTRPIFAAVDDSGELLGYAFCILRQHLDSHILTPIRTLYIDDLCVDEGCRGQHIGSALYDHVLDYARASGCYNVTLNVWACNTDAMAFYQSRGLQPQKIGMETIL